MDQVLGTLKSGRIVLDEQADCAEGQRVAVLPHLDGEPVGTIQPCVELPDGKAVPFNGTPEHFKLLEEQMGRPYPVESMPEEAADFDNALAEVNRRYGDALKKLAE
jgi:hypothetical protein